MPKIIVKIKVNEDSILHVTAYEKISGVNISLDVNIDKGIMNKEEIELMKKKLSNKEDFKKITNNKKEKYLCEKKELEIKDFRDTKNLKSLKSLEKIQEELIEISQDKDNQNNLTKKYKNVKFLFSIYNYLFENYFDEYKKKSDEYLEKIKKYMEIFKNDETFYIKSLVLIFKEDKYEDRISEIIYHCINIFMENINTSENKKYFSSYFNESLELIRNFREKLEKSKLKEEFESLKQKCILGKDLIIIEKKEKIKDNWNFKELTLDEAMISIDQYLYTIQNFETAGDKISFLEKSIKALIITKLLVLELTFLEVIKLEELNKMAKQALNLINETGLNEKTDPWIAHLINSSKIISEKIKEKEEKNMYIRKSLSLVFEININGDDDEKNIEFFELINDNMISENKKKMMLDNYIMIKKEKE